MFSKFPAITILWMGNIRLVLPSSYFNVRCFPYIKFPAASTFQDIDHVFRIAVKKTTIFPREFIIFAKGETQARLNESLSMVLATSTVIQSRLLLSFLLHQRKPRTNQQPAKRLRLSCSHNHATVLKNFFHRITLDIFKNALNELPGVANRGVMRCCKDNRIPIIRLFSWGKHFRERFQDVFPRMASNDQVVHQLI